MSHPPLSLNPEVFGQPASAEPVQLVQTHIGWVYLVGSYAFKLKKAVKFDFLDFTTPEQRHWACEREVALNRRLCPDLYLGLVPILKNPDGTLRAAIEAVNTVPPFTVDWAVWMKRLPSGSMLDELLKARRVSIDDVTHIADVLADFHRRQKGQIPIGSSQYQENFKINVDENFREAQALPADILDPAELGFLEKRGRGFIEKYTSLLSQRVRDGCVIDGHGDLRAENIALPPHSPPVLFDCIEFNDRFRICDQALDAAYLAMDLDSRGEHDLSDAFLEHYCSLCDPNCPGRLLNFFLGYRAFVKAKVAAWIAADSNVPMEKRAASQQQAHELFSLAMRYALREETVLIVCCGPAGSGKSTLALRLARGLNAEHIATDKVRDEVVSRGQPADVRYSRENSERVYRRVYDRANSALPSRRVVILDGTFITRERRAEAVEIARMNSCPCILVWADCPDTKIEQHFSQRNKEGVLLGSEASLGVGKQQLREFQDPLVEEGFSRIVRVDTSGDKEKSQAEAWRKTLNALTELL